MSTSWLLVRRKSSKTSWNQRIGINNIVLSFMHSVVWFSRKYLKLWKKIQKIIGKVNYYEIVYSPGKIENKEVSRIFSDRLCDGIKDCENNEDEIYGCARKSRSFPGCCQTLIIPVNNIECTQNGTFNAAPIYKCSNILNYIYKYENYYLVGFLSDPRIVKEMAWSYKLEVVNNCPDTSKMWKGPNGDISIGCADGDFGIVDPGIGNCSHRLIIKPIRSKQ